LLEQCHFTNKILWYCYVMSERPQGVDPFTGTLSFVRQGVLSAHYELSDNPDYYIVAEPMQEGVPYADTPAILETFEELSGIRVVPHTNVIGLTAPVNERCLMLGDYELDEYGRHQVLFHVARKIQGVSVADDYNYQNPEVPAAEAAKCVEGLVNFHLEAHEQNIPHGDMKPKQIMYGTIDTDEQPRLYMTDLDYAFFHDEGYSLLYETIEQIACCVEFITVGRGPSAVFLPAARRVLEFLERSDVKEIIKDRDDPRMRGLKQELTAYIHSLDLGRWGRSLLAQL
jgi:hypothetical protein